MKEYRKLIVALVGAAVMTLDQIFGVTVAINADDVANVLIPILTAAGVWATPNAA